MTDAVEDTSQDEANLDTLFTVPAYLASNQRYVEIFWTVVNRLRADARGMVLDTANTMMIERLATIYVQIRHHEDAGDWRAGQQKDLNDYFAKLETEFHRQIAASTGVRQGELKKLIVANVVEVINHEVRDDAQRVSLLSSLEVRFNKLQV